MLTYLCSCVHPGFLKMLGRRKKAVSYFSLLLGLFCVFCKILLKILLLALQPKSSYTLIVNSSQLLCCIPYAHFNA